MEPQIYNNASNSYNAAQSFGDVCANHGLEQMANYNQAYISNSMPGLPNDSFNRVSTFTSSRYTEGPTQTQKTLTGLSSFFSSIGMVSKIVGYFFPPAATVSAVSELASPLLTTFAGDTTPKPVKMETTQKYNPWLR